MLGNACSLSDSSRSRPLKPPCTRVVAPKFTGVSLRTLNRRLGLPLSRNMPLHSDARAPSAIGLRGLRSSPQRHRDRREVRKNGALVRIAPARHRLRSCHILLQLGAPGIFVNAIALRTAATTAFGRSICMKWPESDTRQFAPRVDLAAIAECSAFHCR